MKTVIGLAGVKTSGKSTIAEIIKSHIMAEESALADNLKNASAKAFNINRMFFDSQDFKEVPFWTGPKFFSKESIHSILSEFNIEITAIQLTAIYERLRYTTLESPRKIAQIVGTELLREYGGIDIHCKSVKLFDTVTIISDMRFPNEFDYFDRNDDIKFIPLYIQRDEAEQHVDMNKSHVSETSVFLFSDKCVRINNNGTLGDTEKQILEVLKNELGL